MNDGDCAPCTDGDGAVLSTLRRTQKGSMGIRFSKYFWDRGSAAFGALSRLCYQSSNNQTSSGSAIDFESAPPMQTFSPITTSTPSLDIQYTGQKADMITTSANAPAFGSRRFPPPSLSSPMRQFASPTSSRSDPGLSHDTSFSPTYLPHRAASVQTHSAAATPLVNPHRAIQQTESVAVTEDAHTSRIPGFLTSPSRPPASTSSRNVPQSSNLHGIAPSSFSSPIRLRGRAASAPMSTWSPSTQAPNLYTIRTPVVGFQAIQQTENTTMNRRSSTSEIPCFPTSSFSTPLRRSASCVSTSSAPNLILYRSPRSSLIYFSGRNPSGHAPSVISQDIQHAESVVAGSSTSTSAFYRFPALPSTPLARKTAGVSSNTSASSSFPDESSPPVHFSARIASAQTKAGTQASESTSASDFHTAPASLLSSSLPMQWSRSIALNGSTSHCTPIPGITPASEPVLSSYRCSRTVASTPTDNPLQSPAPLLSESQSPKKTSPATKTSRRQLGQNDSVGGAPASQESQSLGRVHSVLTSNSDNAANQNCRLASKFPADQKLITSAHLMSAVDAAVEKYESTAVEHVFFPEAIPSPFLSWSSEALERHFEVIIDAQNALLLRQSTIITDIGISLELLTSLLCTYDKDAARLVSLKEEIELLMHASAERDLDLDFDILENFRSSFPPYDSSFTENNHSLYSTVQPLIDAKRDAQAASLCFLNDPMSLREYRLPLLSTSQR